MSFLGPNFIAPLKLSSRNEGKLKSYGSCTDVRAWRHDDQARADHLKDWIRCDMPICFMSSYTLAGLLRVMTCGSRTRTTPRCHPDCKSKLIIDSLCKSCQAINGCLKCNPKLDKYFIQDELDTSHWPCDRCLIILRSIKMLWKIIVEKVFGINLSKDEDFDNIESENTSTVKSVAKMWEKEIIEQVLFVKSITSLFTQSSIDESNSVWKQTPIRKETVTRIPGSAKAFSKETSSVKVRSLISHTPSFVSQKSKFNDLGRRSSYTLSNSNRKSYKVHRSTSVWLKMKDVSCTCELDKNDDEILSFKRNIAYLQQKCELQESEIEKLKKENISLKYELGNGHRISYDITERHAFVDVLSNCDFNTIIPKPFESTIKDSSKGNIFTSVDSEMIITMKNCRREARNPPESFQHVSLLQILHKTNEPILSEDPLSTSGCKKQNPLELLTKVRNTVGDIVKREIKIISNKKQQDNHDIEATFCKLNKSESAPSCSTFYSDTASTEP